MTEPLFVSAWNPHSSGDFTRIRKFIELTVPYTDLWAFNEVRRNYVDMQAVGAQHCLNVFQEEDDEERSRLVSEKGSTAVLTSPRFFVTGARVIPLTKVWKVFSRNRWHHPRRLVQVRGTKGETRFKVVVVHGPTNGPDGGNRRAYAEFLVVLATILLTTRPGTVIVIVGDFNGKGHELQKWIASGPLAGLGLRMAGHNVDWCLTRGADVKMVRWPTRRGSDHYPFDFTVTPTVSLVTRVRQALRARRRKR